MVILDNYYLLSHNNTGDNMFKSREYYQKIIKVKHDYKVMLKNFFEAYFFGGLVSLFGQGLFDFYNKILMKAESQEDLHCLIVITPVIIYIFSHFHKSNDIGNIKEYF